jgi:hypothetical protein
MDILMKKELVSVNANRSMEEHMALDPKQKDVLNREKEQQLQNKSEPHNIDMYIEQFKKQIKAGPFYICCVCNRTLYKKSVIILKKTKYSVQNCFMVQCSFDGNEYICKTCHTKAPFTLAKKWHGTGEKWHGCHFFFGTARLFL